MARHTGAVSEADARKILEKAGSVRRLLIAGDATVTAGAAAVFGDHGLWLLGNEGQTAGPENAPMEVHKLLLGRGVALLEGIVLQGVPEEYYFFSAAPLNLAGSDGAPCRDYLAETDTPQD